MAVLKNVPVMWASVTKPNTMFNDGQWEIVVVLDKDQANKLQEEAKTVHKKGIKFKEENGKFTFRFRRMVNRRDGNGTNNPPVVIGPDGQPFDKLVGNGSICNVQYSFTAYKNKFGEGVTNDLKGVRVLVHVPFGEQDGDGLMDDDEAPFTKDSNEYDDDL